MAQKDGESSVEDILRSIKQVISREDGPRRPIDSYPRYPVSENSEPDDDAHPEVEGADRPMARGTDRPGSFAPYSFTRSSPFGARTPLTPPEPDAGPAEETEGRPDVFDLRSLDDTAFAPQTPAPQPEDESRPRGRIEQWQEPEVSVEDAHHSASADPAPLHLAETAEISSDGDDSGTDDTGTDDAVDSSSEPKEESAIEAPVELTPAAAATVSEPLIEDAAADALRDRFSTLHTLAAAPGRHGGASTEPNPFEDMVREMLRPMLREWLDENLPGLIEKMVEREIARITGR